jgi:6-phosphogluconolactonase
MQTPQIEIASDAQDLAYRMVQLFLATAGDAIAARGVFHVALSGGHTPELFFRRLAEESSKWEVGRGKVEEGSHATSPALETSHLTLPTWDRIHVFWVDERYVPPDSQASNYRLAAETFLNRVEIPAANIHRIPTEYSDISDAVRAYERTMREVFGLEGSSCVVPDARPQGGPPGPGRERGAATHDAERTTQDASRCVPQFDLIVLGMGSDGHTGSLFPDSYAAYDTDDLACAVYVADETKFNRITLTRPVLLAARRLVVLVSGREKAQTLQEVLTGEPDEVRYPIHSLWPALDRIVWLVDREAAGEMGEA